MFLFSFPFLVTVRRSFNFMCDLIRNPSYFDRLVACTNGLGKSMDTIKDDSFILM